MPDPCQSKAPCQPSSPPTDVRQPIVLTPTEADRLLAVEPFVRSLTATLGAIGDKDGAGRAVLALQVLGSLQRRLPPALALRTTSAVVADFPFLATSGLRVAANSTFQGSEIRMNRFGAVSVRRDIWACDEWLGLRPNEFVWLSLEAQLAQVRCLVAAGELAGVSDV